MKMYRNQVGVWYNFNKFTSFYVSAYTYRSNESRYRIFGDLDDEKFMKIEGKFLSEKQAQLFLDELIKTMEKWESSVEYNDLKYVFSEENSKE